MTEEMAIQTGTKFALYTEAENWMWAMFDALPQAEKDQKVEDLMMEVEEWEKAMMAEMEADMDKEEDMEDDDAESDADAEEAAADEEEAADDEEEAADDAEEDDFGGDDGFG